MIATQEEKAKAEAERILSEMGLSCAEVVNKLYAHIAQSQELPRFYSEPNDETLEAMEELKQNKANRKRYKTVSELMKALNAD